MATTFGIFVVALALVSSNDNHHRRRSYRVLAVYLLVGYAIGVAEAFRRWFRRRGDAVHVHEAREVARALCSVLLIAYTLGWFGASELLLPAFGSDAFGGGVSLFISAALLVDVTLVTCDLVHVDHALVVLLLATLFPTADASPRTASALLSVARLVAMFTLHGVLEHRADGRVAPSASGWQVRPAVGAVLRDAVQHSSQLLVQSAWILNVSPAFVTYAPIVALLAEAFRKQRALRRPDVTDETHHPLLPVLLPASTPSPTPSPTEEKQRNHIQSLIEAQRERYRI